ncbi:MAG TPA: hypothetical protein PKE21_03680 [Flavobacteriales bacterium]|nr:hypothetical protein [Flavobacteriales bacterium]HMR26556.1 hypothetical protein [Flavobacteriales bacterium]
MPKAEGWKNGACRARHEARQGDPLLTGSGQHHPRVQVTSNAVYRAIIAPVRGIVAQDDPINHDLLLVDHKAGIPIAPFAEPVVIARNEVDLLVPGPAPSLEPVPAPVQVAMEQVAQDDQPVRLEMAQHLPEPLQGGRIIAFRKRHSGLAEMGRFAEMQIGDQQPVTFAPEQAAPWVHGELNAWAMDLNVEGQHTGQGTSAAKRSPPQARTFTTHPC